MCTNSLDLDLVLPSHKGFEQIAISAFLALARETSLADRQIARLKTAVAEAVINAMEHGNQFDAHLSTKVQFALYSDRLEIKIQDSGAGGRLTLPEEPPSIEQRLAGQHADRGWGLHMIKNLVDELCLDWTPDQGNQLRLVCVCGAQENAVDSKGDSL